MRSLPARSLLAVLATALALAAAQPAQATATSGTATAGQKVTFAVAADGLAPFAYQWARDGVAIPGATSASFALASVQPADAGSYVVTVSNVLGSASSDPATLTVSTVSAAPVFTLQPASQSVAVGGTVTFQAAATGTPAPTYQWRKGNRTIAGATGSSLTLAGVTLNDAATYTVVATNSAGSATSSGAVLTVLSNAPKFTTQPMSWTVKAGATVTLTSAASGAPAPTYQWRKDGKKIGGATGSSLTLAAVSASTAGTYSVVATNSAGTATSGNAVLKVVAAAAVVPGDFNFDGHADLLWQNATTGERVLWLMNGTTQTGTVSLGTVPLAWSIAGIGDFNGDGNPDIVWQNTSTGERSVWLMNGTALSSVVSLGVASLDWTIAAVGDFNGDGSPDLLWQNTATAERCLWFLNGTTQTGSASLGWVNSDWSIAGAADIDGDGRTDIVWQNTATGERFAWLMNGATQVGTISLGVVKADWVIVGAGDLNGDGRPDLLWQNTGTGERCVWLMSGTAAPTPVSLGYVALDWLLAN